MEAVREKEVKLPGVEICERGMFYAGSKKKEWVIDVQSGESEEEEAMGKGICESVIKELVPEWGWRRDKESWFQRLDEA